MTDFNRLVTGENPIFARVARFMAILNELSSGYNFIRIHEFVNTLPADILRQRLSDAMHLTPDHPKIQQYIDNRTTRVFCQAYPRDVNEFLRKVPVLLRGVLSGGAKGRSALSEYIRDALCYQSIPSNPSECFLGDVELTGKVMINEGVLVVDLCARADECKPNDTGILIGGDSVVVGSTLHGSGSQLVEDSCIVNVVGHGGSTSFGQGGSAFRRSSVGTPDGSSALHNCSVAGSSIRCCGLVANGARFTNTHIDGDGFVATGTVMKNVTRHT